MALSELEQRLCGVIAARRQQMIDELAAHVAIPTGRNHTPGLDQYRCLLRDRLNSLGAQIQLVQGTPRPEWLTLPGPAAAETPSQSPVRIPPTLIATRRVARTTPRVMIAGHLDTVHDPHGSFQQLTIAPDHKTATGPGVVDMKGGILIGVTALEALAECGIDLNWTMLLNSDEETGSFHSFDAITQTARDHDIGIALEPALPDGSLVVQRMGAGQFKAEVFGKAAHVGRDFAQGVSAVNKLAELIIALSRWSDPQRGVIVNVGPLQGGAVTNIVPEYAACWGNVRYSDPAAARRIEQQLDKLASDGGGTGGGARVVVHHAINRPAKPLIPPVQALADRIKSVADDLGQRLPFGSTGGVCDGNIMQAAGLTTIDTLGVRGGNLHRTDEFIDLTSLVERCQLLAILLCRLAERQL